MEDIAKTSHNIVWSAALKNGWLAGDKALAEFLMSLSGTYIYDANGRPKYYASLLADNNNLVDAMLKGGKIEYYKCDNTDEKACLSPQKKELTLAQDKGLEVRIRTTLEALYISVANDTGLTDNQKSFWSTPIRRCWRCSSAQSEATVTRTFRRTRASSRLSC
ncbi:conjugal transfer protein TraH [Vibrio sp. 10N.286.48.B7]|uniref:conjugal transfer protein TraH n=1 Tax=Vibrio sp. 10N.286.48.B7 TaxID=1880853 RepID=UPI0039A5D9AA